MTATKLVLHPADVWFWVELQRLSFSIAERYGIVLRELEPGLLVGESARYYVETGVVLINLRNCIDGVWQQTPVPRENVLKSVGWALAALWKYQYGRRNAALMRNKITKCLLRELQDCDSWCNSHEFI